jgi:hypothetical protein
MWEERERRRAEIVSALEIGQASLARGEGRIVTGREETMRIAEDIKRRGLTKLVAEHR